MRLSLSFLFVICGLFGYAQVIENPVFDRTDQPLFHVDKVELTQDSTIVFCTLSVEEGMWANLSPNTYIENTLTSEKYRIVSCNGLPFAPKEKDFLNAEKCKIRMSFPSCGNPDKISLIETPNEKSLNIYGISLKESFDNGLLVSSIEQAELLSSKANFYLTANNYEKAAHYEEQAIIAKKRLYGKMSEEYENSLCMLGSYYVLLCKFDKAQLCFEEDVKLRSLLYGDNHEDNAAILRSLAICYENQNMSSKAIPLYETALKIQEEYSGKNNIEYATIKFLLAQSYNKIGDRPMAIKVCKEAVDIRRLLLGTNDEDYLYSLLNLAQYNMYSDLNKSKEMLKSVVDTTKVYYGKGNHLYLSSTNLLSQCYMCLKEIDSAMLYAQENAEISLAVYGERSVQYSLSMDLLSQIYAEGMHDYDKAISYGLKSIQFVKNEIPAITYSSMLNTVASYYAKKNDYDNALKISDEAIQVFKNVVINDFYKMTPELKYSLWQKLHFIYDSGYPRFVAICKDELHLMELYDNALFFKGITSNNEIRSSYNWKEIQNSLGSNEIAIEFVQSYENKTITYYALTIKRGYEYPKMHRLLDSNQHDKIIKERDEKRISQSNMLYQLGKFIWGPLTEELDGVDNVYFSPTASFHTIGIEYLPCGDNEYYSDKYNFYRLTSTAKIIQRNPRCEYNKAYLFGGLAYSGNMDLTKEYNNENRSGFDFLANTYDEVLQIADILKNGDVNSKIYSGEDGSEINFQTLEKERFELLHLATHGENVEQSNISREKDFNNLLFLQNSSDINTFVYKNDVMSWSYLVLSGGNSLINRTKIPNDTEDGIITAIEISKMRFQNLDMVVLSACKTALGFFGADDSVLGLQRGFKMAGAETIVMSYREVDDEATKILMVEFYKNLMSGKTKYQSLKNAQLHLRQVEDGKYNHPRYWASFIMLDGLN